MLYSMDIAPLKPAETILRYFSQATQPEAVAVHRALKVRRQLQALTCKHHAKSLQVTHWGVCAKPGPFQLSLHCLETLCLLPLQAREQEALAKAVEVQGLQVCTPLPCL